MKKLCLYIVLLITLSFCTPSSNEKNEEVNDTMGVRLIPNVSNFTDEYGTRHGRWIEVDSTNMIRKEMFYSSGKLDSIYLEWKNGRVVISGFYKLGKKHGVWKYFDSKDSMFKEETYREGELIYRP